MNEQHHLLLTEDEPALARVVKESLEDHGFKVTLATNGQEAIKQFKRTAPDLLIMDVMLPEIDGFEAVKKIRMLEHRTPIIFLTAKSLAKDVVRGFKLGGNDYLKKPFSIEELIVRIENLLGPAQEENNDIHIGEYVLNSIKQTLQFRHEPPIRLTFREAKILYYLGINSNHVVERSLILNQLWGNEDFFTARSMDVFISKLRKHLRRDTRVKILNIRGIGYKLVV